MKKLILLVAIVASLLFGGCIGYYTKMSHLTDDDREWINAYTEGQVVLFHSNLNNVDTLSVSEVKTWDRFNPFFIHFIDNYKGPTYSAGGIYEVSINSDDYCQGSFLISRNPETNSIEYLIRFKNLWYDNLDRPRDSSLGKTKYKNSVHTSTVSIHGRYISNCLVFDTENCKSYEAARKESDREIVKYVINKKHGLIFYQYRDGEYFIKEGL